jgi:CO/xanthine dehydrogenase Mo-binding subunit
MNVRGTPANESGTAPAAVRDDVERYELREGAPYRFELERRTFLRVFATMGGGLAVIAAMPVVAQESGRRGGDAPATDDITAWLHIGEDGRVTACTGKTEIGQNIRTSLAQAVAEELRVPLSSIAMVMADTELVPFDAGTFGSLSTPRMAPVLGRAAAAARELLLDRAAARWQVPRATITLRDGTVSDGSRKATFAELVRGQALTGRVVPDVALTPPSSWTVRGTAPRKVNGRSFVTGAHLYTTDIERPAMQYGCLVRPDGYAGTLDSVDDAAARAMPGVTVVRDSGLVGVVADDERLARRAAAAIRATWRKTAPHPSSDTLYDHLQREIAETGRPVTPILAGDVDAAVTAAARTVKARYLIPYIAHVPLEPRAAVAEWQGDALTVWCGTQRPFGIRSELAEAFRLPESRVRVIVPDTGSAYGGKHTGEHAIEAARLAKAAARPVKLVWTRAEEFSFAYARPAGVIEVTAAVDAAGRLSAWEFHNWNSGASGIRTPYDVANQRIAFHPSASPLRQGSYRGLAATANHHVREMHMDRVARDLGVDAVQFRLAHLSDARLRAVLEEAAQRIGWPRPSAAGRSLGIACGTEKGSYVATAAEVSRAGTGFVVDRLVVAFECGAVVHPDGVRNQVEGAVVQGLGGALFEALTFANGRLTNGTMARYRVPRFSDVPALDVVVLDRKDLPSVGAGETPIVCVAPAIGSAARGLGRVADRLPISFA